ncbi:hypothetical protein OIU76_024107 [Salix suchowensis]|nr:hypothetical protein OIU76_024107 [Salix suchowensis]
MASKDGGVTQTAPADPLVTAAVHKSKNNKRGRSAARKEHVASVAVLGEGAALSSQPSLDAAVKIANGVDFASFSSDPMIAEVAAVVGEWEIVNKKKI